jgi:predicted ArsR family transcriptional regulator
VETVLEEHRGQFEHLPLEKRLDYLVELLSDEGFLSTWERTPDGYCLIEYSCPYFSIGSAHAEVCNFDKQLMSGVLQLEVQQQSCMLQGSNCCQFTIERHIQPAEPLLLAEGN